MSIPKVILDKILGIEPFDKSYFAFNISSQQKTVGHYHDKPVVANKMAVYFDS